MTMNNTFALHQENRLEDALAMLAAGIPLETILAEASDDAEWLRPMLAVVGEMGDLRQAIPIPPPDASLNNMMAQVNVSVPPPAATPQKSWFRLNWQPRLWIGLRYGLAVASLLLMFMLGTLFGGGLSLTAQDSLPGEPLYTLKRLHETVRLNLAQNPARRARLHDTFNQQRRLEAELLLDQGQTAPVAFETHIEAMTGSLIRTGSLTVEITPDTSIEGELTVGARIRLEAVTRPPSGLVALTIVVLEPGPPTSTPTPTPTSTPTLTPTLTPPTPSPSPTAVQGQTGDTVQLSPTPAATGTPDRDDDDENENDNDNSGEDGDDENENGDDDNDNDNENENGDDDNANDNEDEDNESDDDVNDNDDNENSNDNDDDDANENSDEDSDNSNDDNSGSGSDDDDREDDNSGKGSSDDDDDDDDDKD